MKIGVQATLLGLCLLLIYSGASFTQKHESTTPKPNALERQDHEIVKLPATIVPVNVQHVYPQVGGQVRELLVEEGAHVRMGQVIARLDRTEYELKYNIARAMVDHARAHLAEQQTKIKRNAMAITQADAEVKEAAALLVLAERKAARMKELQRNGTVVDSAFEEAETELSAANAHELQLVSKRKLLELEPISEAIAAAKAELTCAELNRDSAKLCLDKTDIRVPVDSTILKKEVEPFTNVGPGWGSDHALSIYRIGDLSQMEAMVSVPQQVISKIHRGQKCIVHVDAVPDILFSGEVARIRPVVSTDIRTITIYVKVKQDDQGRLVPGNHAEVEIPLKN